MTYLETEFISILMFGELCACPKPSCLYLRCILIALILWFMDCRWWHCLSSHSLDCRWWCCLSSHSRMGMHDVVGHQVCHLCIPINCSRYIGQKLQTLSHQRWMVLIWCTCTKVAIYIVAGRLEDIITCLIFRRKHTCGPPWPDVPPSIMSISESSMGRCPSNAAGPCSKIYGSPSVSRPSAEWREWTCLHVTLTPFYPLWRRLCSWDHYVKVQWP